MACKDSIISIAGTIVQCSVTQMFKNSRHDSSTVGGMIVQKLLARLFNNQENLSLLWPGTIL